MGGNKPIPSIRSISIITPSSSELPPRPLPKHNRGLDCITHSELRLLGPPFPAAHLLGLCPILSIPVHHLQELSQLNRSTWETWNIIHNQLSYLRHWAWAPYSAAGQRTLKRITCLVALPTCQDSFTLSILLSPSTHSQSRGIKTLFLRI